MKYNLSNPLHRQQLRTRLEVLMKKDGGVVELREVKPARTNKQNAYLHTLIAYFGLQVGESAEYVKREYYKRAANRQMFEYEHEDKITKTTITQLRSSTTLSTDEMTLTIERFRNWSASVAGIYLPSPEDHAAITEMELEVERAREWL